MVLKKLPLEGNLKDPIALKVNEIIEYIHKVEALFGELPETSPDNMSDEEPENAPDGYDKELSN